MMNILSRSLAGEYPYDPDYMQIVRHPSQRHRLQVFWRELPKEALGFENDLLVRAVSKDVRRILGDRAVFHLAITTNDAGKINGWDAVVQRDEYEEGDEPDDYTIEWTEDEDSVPFFLPDPA